MVIELSDPFVDLTETCSGAFSPELRRIEIDFRGDGSLRNAPLSDWQNVVTLSATQSLALIKQLKCFLI